jgi:cell wall-associated NlpC family hydrolase
MTTRADVVIIARGWLETPYRHQKKLRGVGVDCIGLIWGVGLEAGVLTVPADEVRPFLAYSRLPSPKRFMRALELFFRRVDGTPQPADIAVMAWDLEKKLPQHVGLLSDLDGRPGLIHSESRVGRCVEHGFVGEWPQRVTSWWRYPGIEE